MLELADLGADLERALFDVNVVGYVLDRDGIVVWQNRAAIELVGDARGTHFLDYIAPAARRRAQEAFVSKVFGNVPYTDMTVEMRHPSGATVSLDVSSVPLYRDGKVVGVLGLLTRPPAREGDARPRRLTPRQLDVLRLLAAGASTQQIADELHITVETVRNHVRAVLAELNVHSRVEAVAAARAAGLLD